MAAYVIAEIEVHDTAAYKTYMAEAPASIARHGGRYLARGGTSELLEGGPSPKRIVILEFPTLAAAKGWFHSDDYEPASRLRQSASACRFIVTEGL